MTVALQIAPQRGTQYSALASALAPHEAAVCLGMPDTLPFTLVGQAWLRVDVDTLDTRQREVLGDLGAISAAFELRDAWGDTPGPWLRPIEALGAPARFPDLVTARRYKGKTNELLTRVMLNLARHTSAYANTAWRELRVLDPLAGGGTTLFSAMSLGASAFGIDRDGDDMASTATFVRQFFAEAGLPATHKEERLKGIGRRWLADISGQVCVLAHGETAHTPKLLNGHKKAHLIVTDLPYGIQHQGPLLALLREALPAWAAMCMPNGALVFSWDATRLPRADMLATVVAAGGWTPRTEPPFDQMAHPVDRVIKHREILVATLT
jgi:hypothetical protein